MGLLDIDINKEIPITSEYLIQNKYMKNNLKKKKEIQLMASCLGLYIEPNLIKYAKVSKNNDALKVESFGVKFFENINVANIESYKLIFINSFSKLTPLAYSISK